MKHHLSGTADFLKKQILFFLDKDHTEHLGDVVPEDDRIYITDYYSIENHMACKEVLEDICKVSYGLSILDALYAEVLGRFDVLIDGVFAEAVSPMALSICARQKGHEVLFKKVKIKQVFDVNEDLNLEVKCDPTEYFRNKLGIPESLVSVQELALGIESLRAIDPRKVLRGHFHMELFVRFLENIRVYAENRNVKVKKKGIRSEDIFGLSTKGRPASLDEFFKFALTE